MSYKLGSECDDEEKLEMILTKSLKELKDNTLSTRKTSILSSGHDILNIDKVSESISSNSQPDLTELNKKLQEFTESVNHSISDIVTHLHMEVKDEIDEINSFGNFEDNFVTNEIRNGLDMENNFIGEKKSSNNNNLLIEITPEHNLETIPDLPKVAEVLNSNVIDMDDLTVKEEIPEDTFPNMPLIDEIRNSNQIDNLGYEVFLEHVSKTMPDLPEVGEVLNSNVIEIDNLTVKEEFLDDVTQNVYDLPKVNEIRINNRLDIDNVRLREVIPEHVSKIIADFTNLNKVQNSNVIDINNLAIKEEIPEEITQNMPDLPNIYEIKIDNAIDFNNVALKKEIPEYITQNITDLTPKEEILENITQNITDLTPKEEILENITQNITDLTPKEEILENITQNITDLPKCDKIKNSNVIQIVELTPKKEILDNILQAPELLKVHKISDYNAIEEYPGNITQTIYDLAEIEKNKEIDRIDLTKDHKVRKIDRNHVKIDGITDGNKHKIQKKKKLDKFVNLTTGNKVKIVEIVRNDIKVDRITDKHKIQNKEVNRIVLTKEHKVKVVKIVRNDSKYDGMATRNVILKSVDSMHPISAFKCFVCSKAFLTKDSHKEHMMKHAMKCNQSDKADPTLLKIGKPPPNKCTIVKVMKLTQPTNTEKDNYAKILDEYLKSINKQKIIDIDSMKSTKIEVKKYNDYQKVPSKRKSTEQNDSEINLTNKYDDSTHSKLEKERKSIEKVKRITRYKCVLCGYKCNNREELEKHVSKHHRVKSYTCFRCDYKTDDRLKLEQHFEIHVQTEYVKSYSCVSCQFECSQRNQFDEHIKSHVREDTFSCNFCDLKFNKRCDLDDHVVVHNDLVSFSCMFCDYVCLLRAHLDSHMQRCHCDSEIVDTIV